MLLEATYDVDHGVLLPNKTCRIDSIVELSESTLSSGFEVLLPLLVDFVHLLQQRRSSFVLNLLDHHSAGRMGLSWYSCRR